MKYKKLKHLLLSSILFVFSIINKENKQAKKKKSKKIKIQTKVKYLLNDEMKLQNKRKLKKEKE
jgi:hypothetical protein